MDACTQLVQQTQGRDTPVSLVVANVGIKVRGVLYAFYLMRMHALIHFHADGSPSLSSKT